MWPFQQKSSFEEMNINHENQILRIGMLLGGSHGDMGETLVAKVASGVIDLCCFGP